MKVKKNLSIEDDILKLAEDRAKSLHLSFAAYIVTLLHKDMQGERDEYIQVVRKTDSYRGMAQDIMDSVDSILNMG